MHVTVVHSSLRRDKADRARHHPFDLGRNVHVGLTGCPAKFGLVVAAFVSQRVGTAKEMALGLGDEADRAKARQQAEDAAEREQRRQNWTAIDSLVQEFIPEAVRRNTPKARGLIFKKRCWCVQHAESERDRLMIWKSGKWSFERVNAADSIQMLGYSWGSRKSGPGGPNPVDGLREGARRLLNS
jgi:hypothetical protein